MYYYISLYDMSVMEIREIVLQQKGNAVTAYFFHPRITNGPAFSAHISFQMRDQGKWYTSIKIHSATDVNVNQEVEDRLREQLTRIFVPCFNKMIDEGKLW